MSHTTSRATRKLKLILPERNTRKVTKMYWNGLVYPRMKDCRSKR